MYAWQRGIPLSGHQPPPEYGLPKFTGAGVPNTVAHQICHPPANHAWGSHWPAGGGVTGEGAVAPPPSPINPWMRILLLIVLTQLSGPSYTPLPARAISLVTSPG